MTGTNVYKNYTATLAELYRREISAATDIGEITLGVSRKDEASFLKTFSVALVGFAAVAGLALLIINPFKSGSDFPEYVPETAPKPIVTPNTQYVQIQLIEFEDAPENLEILPSLYNGGDKAEESAAAVSPEITPAPVKPETAVPPKAAAPKPVAATPAKPAAPKPAPKAAPAAAKPALYSIKVDGITPSEYARIKELSGMINITADRLTEHRNMWALYIPSSGTGMFIEGEEVLPLSYYASKEDALKAAEEKAERGELSILKQESVRSDLFNVSLCCMELDNAKQLAQKSGITDKIFQLRRRQL
jgi:hypothetical protein